METGIECRGVTGEGGFSLLELVVAMVLVGLLAGGGGLLLRTWQEHRLREETLDYVEEVRRAIIAFAKVNQRLPAPDAPPTLTSPSYKLDGLEETSALNGYVPYATLGVRPTDSWGRRVRYHVSNKMANPTFTLDVRCNDLRGFPTPLFAGAYLNNSGYVKVVQEEKWFVVPAALVSGGGRDADGVGSKIGNASDNSVPPDAVFDKLGTYSNSYANSPPNAFVKAAQQAGFDDIVLFIDPITLFYEMSCNNAAFFGGKPVRPLSPP